MQRILAILNSLDSALPVLATAQLVAAQCAGSRIVALHPRLPQDPSFMPTEEVMTYGRRQAFNVMSSAEAETIREVFDAWQADLVGAANASWIEIIGEPRRSVSAEASRADLIVVAHVQPHERADIQTAFHAALYDAAAPVIVAPIKCPEVIARRPAIAWKDSPAVSKAISAAWPLLHNSVNVTVLSGHLKGHRAVPPPRKLTDALEQAGITWSLDEFELANRHIGDALLLRAREVHADLLIMGAYTHIELIEWLRGGATQEILWHSTIPLLMHH